MFAFDYIMVILLTGLDRENGAYAADGRRSLNWQLHENAIFYRTNIRIDTLEHLVPKERRIIEDLHKFCCCNLTTSGVLGNGVRVDGHGRSFMSGMIYVQKRSYIFVNDARQYRATYPV